MIQKKMKFIINIGLARCGTTSLHLYMGKNPSVATPVASKEIKYFLNDAVGLDGYLGEFRSGGEGVHFESSPPYAHKGIEAFKKIATRIASVLGDRCVIVFNVRPLIERAFSHYWHDINKHHALYGKQWQIRDRNDKRRFNFSYDMSFYDEITDKNGVDKFLPKVFEQIKICIDLFGKENVNVVPLRYLTAGIEELSRKLDIPQIEDKMPKTTGTKSPYYLYGSGSGSVVAVQMEKGEGLIRVPAGHLLLVHEDQMELLSKDQYDIRDIMLGSTNWTRSISMESLPGFVTDYLKEQFELANDVPESCFLGAKKHDALTYLKENKKLSVSIHKPGKKAFEALGLTAG